MTGHVEVAEREILIQASSEAMLLPEEGRMTNSHGGCMSECEDPFKPCTAHN